MKSGDVSAVGVYQQAFGSTSGTGSMEDAGGGLRRVGRGIDVNTYVDDWERLLRSGQERNGHYTTAYAFSALVHWQHDWSLDERCRRRARALVQEFRVRGA